jgi:predicted membrane metal-binding protein
MALTASLLAALVVVGYVLLMGAETAIWFAAGMLLSALLAGYAADREAPRRTAALAVSAAILIVLGVLGLASIGLPIIGIGVLALIASTRSRDDART